MIKKTLPVDDDFKTKAPKEIFEYFAGQFLNGEETQTRDFLLETAFLLKMTVEMVQKLTGIREAKKAVSRLNKINYFIMRYSTPSLSYQYHPMFRQFLLTKAKQIFSPGIVKQWMHSTTKDFKKMILAQKALDLYKEDFLQGDNMKSPYDLISNRLKDHF